MNFNGTAGIWRKECIDDAGGWHTATLVEDLDLSYQCTNERLEMCVYSKHCCKCRTSCTDEWCKKTAISMGKGSIQCAVKLLGDILVKRKLQLKQNFKHLFS